MATIEQLIRRAEKGVAKAQYQLGEIYECGRGVAKNELEAEKWYLKAAQQGDESSQVALALLYTLGGEKIPPNETESVKWTLEAAKLGNAEMQCAMGHSYASGKVIPKDESESKVWFSRAAAQGHIDAFTALGGMDGSQRVKANLALASIVGDKVVTRAEVDSKLWKYIEGKKLQDASDSTLINADETLRTIFLGKTQLSIPQVAELVTLQVSPTHESAFHPEEETYGNSSSYLEHNSGFVYVLVNSAMPGLLKIGYTDRDPKLRASELSAASGVVVPFIVAYHIQVSDAERAEADIHRALGAYRVNDGREFFAMEVCDAIAVIDSICGRHTSSSREVDQMHAGRLADEDRMDEWAGAAAAYLYRHGYIDYKIIRSKLGIEIDYQDSLKVFEILQGRGLVRKDGTAIINIR